MSLANLSVAYDAMSLRTRMAEDEVNEFSELLAQFLLDDDPGAKEFLMWVAKMWREEHPKIEAVDEATENCSGWFEEGSGRFVCGAVGSEDCDCCPCYDWLGKTSEEIDAEELL